MGGLDHKGDPGDKGDFDDGDRDIYNRAEANTALIGIQLDDPVYRQTFTSPTAPTVASAAPGSGLCHGFCP